MRYVKNYNDLRDLFNEYDVVLFQKDNKVLILFAGNRGNAKDYSRELFSVDPKYLQSNGIKLAQQDDKKNPGDRTHRLMIHLTRYVIRTLVSSPEFIRKTTVAHHIGGLRFHSDIFIGIKGTYKKVDSDLTIVFDTEKNAENFMKKMKYYSIDNINKRFNFSSKQIKIK